MAEHTPITREDILKAIDDFDWDAWREELRKRYAGWHTDVVQSEGKAVAERLGGTWRNDDPFVTRFADRYVAERVTQLDETTRTELRDTVNSFFDAASEDGGSISITGIASALREKFEDFSGARAASIARNENAIAQNHGAAMGYIAAGFNYVQISDGDGDDDCANANGQVWSVSYWLAYPIAHPNCERSAQPISDDEAKELGIDQE